MSQLARDLARALDPVAARAIFGADAKHAALSPASLALAVDRRYEVPPHLELLDSAIVETVATGGRLLVEMPPRHGKSVLLKPRTQTSKPAGNGVGGMVPDDEAIRRMTGA